MPASDALVIPVETPYQSPPSSKDVSDDEEMDSPGSSPSKPEDSSGDESGKDESSKEDSGGDESEGNQGKNALEWVVFAIGVAIVLGVTGFLIYELVVGSDRPARLTIELGEQTQRDGVVEIEVTVRNDGDSAAEGATVEVCGGVDTCAELMFAYLPAHSERTGVMGLSMPLSGPLETRTVSFKK